MTLPPLLWLLSSQASGGVQQRVGWDLEAEVTWRPQHGSERGPGGSEATLTSACCLAAWQCPREPVGLLERRKCDLPVLYTWKFTVVVHQPKVIGIVVLIFPLLIFRFFFFNKVFF